MHMHVCVCIDINVWGKLPAGLLSQGGREELEFMGAKESDV